MKYHLKFFDSTRIIGEGNSLVNLGAVLIALELYSEALKYWHTALEIFREINALETEAYLLNNFAKFYQNLGECE